jgi:ABC-type transport system involved in cytochrome bd biosynthesis fused ATPase/permease subunit
MVTRVFLGVVIRHGRVTAVMGPSGAGKSTFLTTLSGKATYGTTTGVIEINGARSNLSAVSTPLRPVPHHSSCSRASCLLTVCVPLCACSTRAWSASYLRR